MMLVILLFKPVHSVGKHDFRWYVSASGVILLQPLWMLFLMLVVAKLIGLV